MGEGWKSSCPARVGRARGSPARMEVNERSVSDDTGAGGGVGPVASAGDVVAASGGSAGGSDLSVAVGTGEAAAPAGSGDAGGGDGTNPSVPSGGGKPAGGDGGGGDAGARDASAVRGAVGSGSSVDGGGAASKKAAPAGAVVLEGEALAAAEAAQAATGGVYDEVEIEDMEYDAREQQYTYPCPCGDRFVITKDDLLDGEDLARCPSCSLIIRVIYDPDDISDDEDDDEDRPAPAY
uniref:Diphthamide biosynthesis protein 3 n=1 Tax=Bicosoecida sp. CB-2014 TaxID=1486930 RepID=A0A7S1G4L0_9STRA